MSGSDYVAGSGAAATWPNASDSQIEITGFVKSDGPLTKRISLAPDGTLKSDGSACVMWAGSAHRIRFSGLDTFAACIANLGSNEAIALGALRDGLPDQVKVTTKLQLKQLNGAATPGLITRTSDYITYRAGQLALDLIDVDTKGMPTVVRCKIDTLGGFWPALVLVLSELKLAGRAIRRSTSTGMSRTDNGELVPGSSGLHVFVLVKDGKDVERFLKVLHARCWLHGLGWMMVGEGGQLLERSLVDRMVYAPERLVFEAAPLLDAPLVQNHASRNPIVIAGLPLDTRVACQNLTIVEQARLRDLLATEKRRVAPAADKARAAFIARHAQVIAARTGCTLNAARDLVERVVLPFDAAENEGATVGDVLADPDRYVGATLADPLEGLDYGRCKAKIIRRSDGTLWIHSFAHGRTVYDLKHDGRSAEAAIRAVDPCEAADTLVRLLLAAELEADEEQHLRELVCKLASTKARPLAAKIKAARVDKAKRRAQLERERRAAERTDPRIKLPLPPSDAELLPVLRTIDDVLHGSSLAEPPTRDLDLWPVEVRVREAFRLRGMTVEEADPVDGSQSDDVSEPAVRLPPPKMRLLTRHDKFSMAHLIETHIEFIQETEDGERSVALYPKFVEHYIHFRGSRLPLVGAVVTNPLVLPDGDLLVPDGLDRERRVVFSSLRFATCCQRRPTARRMPSPERCISLSTNGCATWRRIFPANVC